MASGSFWYVGITFSSLGGRMTHELCVTRRTTCLRAQRPEARANLFREDLGLLPGSEVTALVNLVVVDELGESLLRPAARSRIELVREDGHGNGDLDALGVEEPELVFPIQTARRNARVGQPGQRDVVEEVIACDAARLSGKRTCDQLVAACVVVQQVAGQAHG